MNETSQLNVEVADPNIHKAPSLIKRLCQLFSKFLANLQYRITLIITNYPILLRIYYAWRRRTRPVKVGNSRATVTRYIDVVDVLSRPEDLLLAEFLHPKMLGGNFLLSMDWREQHQAERGALWNAVHKMDTDYVRGLVAQKCEEVIDKARGGKRNGPHTLDVATNLAEEVATHVLVSYLGIERPCWLKRHLRKQASVIIVSPPPESDDRREADAIAANLSTFLDQEITKKSVSLGGMLTIARGRNKQSLMERLVRASNDEKAAALTANEEEPSADPWLNEDWIRRFLFGLLSTGSATIARATTHAFDRLLANPKALKDAADLADRLTKAMESAQSNPKDKSLEDKVNDLRGQLQLYAYEALRFRPMLPMLGRFCPRDTLVGRYANETRKIPAGFRVVSPPIAAMFDPDKFPRPHQFCPSRPKANYIHFGTGVHECFGRFLADTQIVEMLRILLMLPNVRRAGFFSGRVKYDGPAVKTLNIHFD